MLRQLLVNNNYLRKISEVERKVPSVMYKDVQDINFHSIEFFLTINLST